MKLCICDIGHLLPVKRFPQSGQFRKQIAL